MFVVNLQHDLRSGTWESSRCVAKTHYLGHLEPWQDDEYRVLEPNSNSSGFPTQIPDTFPKSRISSLHFRQFFIDFIYSLVYSLPSSIQNFIFQVHVEPPILAALLFQGELPSELAQSSGRAGPMRINDLLDRK